MQGRAGGNHWVSPSVCSVRVYNYGPTTGMQIAQQPELFFPPNVCPNCDLCSRFLLLLRGWRGLCDNADLCTVALCMDSTHHTPSTGRVSNHNNVDVWRLHFVPKPRTTDSDTLRRFLLFAPECPGYIPAVQRCYLVHATTRTLSCKLARSPDTLNTLNVLTLSTLSTLLTL